MKQICVAGVPSRRTIRLVLLMATAVAVAAGCGSDKCTCPTCWEDVPQIAFAGTAYNAAWGQRYAAWYIDYAGSVFEVSARAEAADRLWAIEDDGLITLSELKTLEAYGTPLNMVVDVDSLRAMRKLIPAASTGSILEHGGQCADCGVWRYLGLLRDYENMGYRTILLYQGGEERLTNDSPEAKQLHEWLKGVMHAFPAG